MIGSNVRITNAERRPRAGSFSLSQRSRHVTPRRHRTLHGSTTQRRSAHSNKSLRMKMKIVFLRARQDRLYCLSSLARACIFPALTRAPPSEAAPAFALPLRLCSPCARTHRSYT